MIFLGKILGEFAFSYGEIKWIALFNVLLAAMLIGVIAHELVNVLLLAHPMKICLHMGELPTIVSICCLSKEEMAQWWLSSEIIPICMQFSIMLAWVYICKSLYVKN